MAKKLPDVPVRESLLDRIWEGCRGQPWDLSLYADTFEYCRIEEAEGDPGKAHAVCHALRDQLVRNLRRMDIVEGRELYEKTLLFDSLGDFDCYLLYLEKEREPKDRFYQPRRKILRPLVYALQRLADGELDELFLSMPPRVGKTSLLLFYMTWLIGRDAEKSNLYSAYSDMITSAFYQGVLEVINDPVTYRWFDVFPKRRVVQTNAANETLNIDRRKRYPSLTCRSLYGTLNGACDCNGILVSDDLIGGIEEALNKDRMIAAWGKVDNNLIPRAKEQAKILWCGTRWSVIDPAGIRMELLQNDEKFANRRFEIINTPALNEDDESNFDYDYGVGFSTDYYRQRRASFERNNDIASWQAQYMGEPIEREGALFTPDGFRYYNGTLPDGEPDRIFMPVDPAFGGGDYVAAPVCVQYGGDIYVHGVVYNNGDKKITQPLIAEAVEKYGIQAAQFEGTKTTESYREGVEELLNAKGIRINLTSKPAPNTISKHDRIFDKAPDIREMMIFREEGKRSREYNLFMQNVFAYKVVGKNRNDDAPDSLAMAVDMVLRKGTGKAEIFRRFF